MSSIILSSEVVLWAVMFVGSGILTLLLAPYVPSSVEHTDVADHPTIVGWIEIFVFMLLFLWTIVSLIAVVLFGFAEMLAFLF